MKKLEKYKFRLGLVLGVTVGIILVKFVLISLVIIGLISLLWAILKKK